MDKEMVKRVFGVKEFNEAHLTPEGEKGDMIVEALSRLNIGDYRDRIFHSNSHGDLFHCEDYIFFAENLTEKGLKEFRGWFEAVVKCAEKNWERPGSVFQHIYTIFMDDLSYNREKHLSN
jgi:hypothetical protein